jgi:LmbE family N-acetylglucosaminyl deacetylase
MRIPATLAAISLALTVPFSSFAQNPDEPGEETSPATLSLLVLMAHPDDEITIAPILSRLVRDGATITLVFATSGDAGPGVTDMEMGAELAELRESEARCAAFALGLPEPEFWRMGDGTLSHRPRDADSPARDLIGRIDQAIARTKPQTIITWGPDGGYGHGDHRMMSDATAQVLQSMGEDRPDLMFTAFPSEDRAALPEFEQWATTHPSLVTDRIAYEPRDLAATRNALDCYESQFAPPARAGLADLLHNMVWRGSIHFRLAFPAPLRPPPSP